MNRTIVTTTRPNDEGEMLWCVHYGSSYYDNDPRMPSDVPIDGHFFVLARSQQEAIKKVGNEIKKLKKGCDKKAAETITANVVALENLIPCRDYSSDGRMGWVPTNSTSPVTLTCEVDKARYRLAVCLVPVEE